LCRGPPKDFEIKFVLNNGRNKFSFSYDISPLSRVKLKILTARLTACGSNFKFNSLEWRNIVSHGQLKENLYLLSLLIEWKILIFCKINKKWLFEFHLMRELLYILKIIFIDYDDFCFLYFLIWMANILWLLYVMGHSPSIDTVLSVWEL
jgi:hypothetical protein